MRLVRIAARSAHSNSHILCVGLLSAHTLRQPIESPAMIKPSLFFSTVCATLTLASALAFAAGEKPAPIEPPILPPQPPAQTAVTPENTIPVAPSPVAASAEASAVTLGNGPVKRNVSDFQGEDI